MVERDISSRSTERVTCTATAAATHYRASLAPVPGGRSATKAYQSAHDLTGSINGLDTTVRDLAKDGVVTEAEKAAVKKAKQDVEKEREELTSQYNALKSNKDPSTSSPDRPWPHNCCLRYRLDEGGTCRRSTPTMSTRAIMQ
ncbi:MAG: hypothetical protein ACLTHL_07310 [Collinsella sp.]